MKRTILFLMIVLILFGAVGGGYAQGTAFTYQGRLNTEGNPANGLYELQFTVYDAEIGGRVIGRPLNARETPVSNGLFNVTLDFRENIFTGGERWLEIAIGTGGEFSPLRPRQRFTAAPYALTAGSVTGPIAVSQLPASVALLNGDQTFTGAKSFEANVGIGTEASSAKLSVGDGDVKLMRATFHAEGFEGTTFPPAGWTTDSFSPWTRTTGDFSEGGAAASHSGADFASSSISYSFNFPTAGFVKFDWKLSSGIFDSLFFMVDNTISNQVQGSIGWRQVEVPVSAGIHSFQWYHDVFRDDTGRAWVDNVRFTDRHGNLFVDGKIEAESLRVQGSAELAKLHVGANRSSEGFDPVPQQVLHLTVPSGYGEGMRIDSDNPGHAPAIYLNHSGPNGHTFRIASFGDNVDPGSFRIFDDTRHADRLVIDANGKISGNGAGLTIAASNITGSFTGSWHVGGLNSELSIENRDVGSYVQSPGLGQRWVLYSRNEGASGRLFFWSGGDKASIDTGGNLRTAGAINPPSDRNVKANFAEVNAREVLEKISAVPIRTWNYTNDPSTRHIGPVAQDFHAAFGLGSDDKHIATVDADGVALAAIQGLNQKLEEKEARIEALERTVAELKGIVERLAPTRETR